MGATVETKSDREWVEAYKKAIETMSSIAQHYKLTSRSKSEVLYYELLGQSLVDFLKAVEDGKLIVSAGSGNPGQQLTYAFDNLALTPIGESAVRMRGATGGLKEANAVAAGLGLGPDVCSALRSGLGGQWVGTAGPTIAASIGTIFCDGAHKGADMGGWAIRSLQSYFIDRPFNYGEAEFKYFMHEMEGAVEFLEKVAGQKMNWDKLEGAVKSTEEIEDLLAEINELRKAVPAPMKSKASQFITMIKYNLMGRPQGVNFMRVLRDEVKERVEQHRGYINEERYRLIDFYEPPVWCWRILDWLENEHGAVIAAEPCHTSGFRGSMPVYSDSPLEALARWTITQPYCWAQNGPVENAVHNLIRGAKEYQAEGVVIWSDAGCVPMSGIERILKDALDKEVGIPFCTIAMDRYDPTTTTEQQIKEQLENFLEILDERK